LPLPKVFHKAAELVACAMFACVFAVFLLKIVMRYTAGDALAWADEVSTVLFVWIIFWTNAFIVPDRRQIAFDLFYRYLPPGGRRVVAALRLLLVGGLFAWSLPGVVDYLRFLWRERTPVLQWRLDLVYACFGLFVAAVVVRAVWGLVRLARAGWRDGVAL
jgi:TRAP-type C4-dicarboxylate transport system permease small subunit